MPTQLAKSVLDLSFMDLRGIEDIRHAVEEGRANKPKITCVKLQGNEMRDLKGLAATIGDVIGDVKSIKWLDLSCNKIEEIADVFNDFENLHVLNLHGNNISKFTGLKHMSRSSQLRSLTLHGNPLTENKHYRNYIIHFFPNLTQFDFGAITKRDREASDTWALTFRRKLNPGMAEF